MNNLELSLLITAAVLLGPVTMVALMNLLVWPRRLSKSAVGKGQVSVLIPARNERDNLEACVDSALSQGDAVKEILIYNDGSTDGTQQVLDRLVTVHQDTVRQVQTENLPAGWVGRGWRNMLLHHGCCSSMQTRDSKGMPHARSLPKPSTGKRHCSRPGQRSR